MTNQRNKKNPVAPRKNNQPSNIEDQKNIMEKVEMQAIFSGPLPQAAELKRYDDIQPGFAERIVAMAEKQQAHRHELEKKDIEVFAETEREKLKQEGRGQIFAFISIVLMVLAGGFLAWLGYSGLALALTGSSLAFVIFAYYNYQRDKNKN